MKNFMRVIIVGAVMMNSPAVGFVPVSQRVKAAKNVKVSPDIKIASAPKGQNQLIQVDHHVVTSKDAAVKNLELGKVSLYFKQDLTINPLPAHTEKIEKNWVFFIPAADIVADHGVRAQLKSLKQNDTMPYSIDIQVVSKPTKGIMLIVKLDPENVLFECETYTAIQGQNSVVFKFYDKQLLAQIQKKDKDMLRMACATPKRSVVIDCGHGGSDTGAQGYFSLKEKDLTLDLGLSLAQLLRNDGLEVFLTRDHDVTLALDQRTLRANGTSADLFVSIHANSAPSSAVRGVETFCLADNLFTPCFSELGSRDKSVIKKFHHDRNEKSLLLAQNLQNNILESIKKKDATVVDRHVKHSVSQVLLGSRMPAALIEVAFVSNEDDALLLKNYKHLLVQGMRDGINSYLACA